MARDTYPWNLKNRESRRGNLRPARPPSLTAWTVFLSRNSTHSAHQCTRRGVGRANTYGQACPD
jgi:hypothetical protein